MSKLKVPTIKRKPLRVSTVPDPALEAEELEIKRLERLLGLSKKKSRKSTEAKLNAEFSKEGIGDDFGSFLFELDDLTDRVRTECDKGHSKIDDFLSCEELDEISSSKDERSTERATGEKRPSKHHDLYGSVDNQSKYVPPAKRLKTEMNDKEALVARKVTGLVNKISEGNKDIVVREMMVLYEENSHTITSSSIVESIFQNLKITVSKLSNLCLLYAELLSALHFSVGMEVTAHFVEAVFENFRVATIDSIAKEDVHSKFSHNLLITLCGLYDQLFGYHFDSANQSTHGFLRLEFIDIILFHCGEFLKADEPTKFQHGLDTITNSDLPITADEDLQFRQKFLIESLIKIRNGNITATPFTSNVRGCRKWLGVMKMSLVSKKSDTMLNVSMSDLSNAIVSGRWWRVGASWRNVVPKSDLQMKASGGDKSKDTGNEDAMDQAAAKLKLSGGKKKDIFRVLMTSRDVMDAFESLMRLDLKGKGDRDIVRVLCECCSHESPYNSFYSEISKLLCERTRQAKITFQFVIWDAIKSFRVSQHPQVIRHTVNIARMTADLVATFHLPLILLKIFNPAELVDVDIQFLTVFITSLLLSDAGQNGLKDIVDRIATSKDISSVRDLMLMFLQVHYQKELFPKDRAMELRNQKKNLIRQLRDMKVLDLQS